MVALLWIFLSDRVLEAIAGTPARLTQLQTVKGTLYVAITAVLLYALISRGVRQLRRAMAAEREQHALLRGVVNNTSEAIAVHGLDGRYLLANRAAHALLGRSDEAIVGHTNDEMFDSGLAATLNEAAAVAQESGEPRTVELNREIGGERKRILVSFSPWRDDHGHIAGAIVVAHDITEHSEREEETRRSETRLRLFFEQVPAIVWTVDRDLVITSIAGSALPVIERGQGRMEGIVIASRVEDPAERERIRAAHRRALAGEIGTYDSTAGAVNFESRVEPVRGPDGSISGAIGIALDVTERVRAERLLREQEELVRQAQKMEAVGRLAGGLAHDFNNLLTVITSSADLMASAMAASDPRREDVREIRRAADRAAGLVRELLAFSSQQFLQPTVVDVHELLGEARPMLTRSVRADIALTVDSQPGSYIVRADRRQLEQVFVNLAMNARDAMPGGGTLRISVAVVTLAQDRILAEAGLEIRAGEYVCIRFTDSGQGMDAETRARIFEPFFSTRKGGAARGLGLAVVYGIVAQSGGFIEVDSVPGEGTEFRIFLPLAGGTAQRPVTPDEPLPAQRGSTVLLAEDEDAVRRLARRILEREGFHVIEARDGAEALELCQAAGTHIDLVLSDVVMPRLGGRELVERCLSLHPGARAVLMSGYTDDDLVRSDVVGSRAAFLAKPFTPEAMIRKVREALETARP